MELLNQLADIFNPNNNIYSKIMPIAAIWLDKPVQTSTDKKCRIAEGEFVYVDEKGKIQDCTREKKANYLITSCWGNINNTVLYFNAIHVKTLQFIKITIKTTGK